MAEAVGVDFVHDRGGTGDKHYPETMGSGVAWLDFDGDGWWDLYLMQSGPFPPRGQAGAANRLFRNLGGSFEDVTERSGVGHRGFGQGVVAADADGDGTADLYLGNYGADALLLNRGDGTFADATPSSGLGLGGWTSSAAFGDGDGDGDLDLYVTRYLVYPEDNQLFCGDPETGRRQYCDPALFEGESDRYYKNRGDGRFDDATREAGFAGADGKGMGVLFTDLDGDRFADVYVANDLTLNLLYRNLGGGRSGAPAFEDLSLLSGTALNRDGKPEAGMGVAAGDVDGDGRPDLAVSNFDVETNTLYRNLGQMLFEDIAAESGFGPPSFNFLAFGIVLVDLDLDGDLDAYVANGHVRERPRRENVFYAERDLVLLGDGGGGFRELRCDGLERDPGVGRGVAWSDFDHDGDPDLAVQNNDSRFELLRNETADYGWLGVRLRGRGGNTEAVGAEVRLLSGDHEQTRRVVAGDSYQSSSDKRLLFGLGAVGEADEIEIVWPSGKVRRLVNPPGNAYLTFREP
ncbi:MAG: CRTAC1 family protein [Thermoanaerobaculia bacterium]